MDTSTERGYTAKFIDGPLEGRTMTTAFLDSGDPRARLEIPSSAGGKRLVYVRSAGLEFEAEDDPRPTAADYRYLETLFD